MSTNSVIFDRVTAGQQAALDSFDLQRYVWIGGAPLQRWLYDRIDTLIVDYTMEAVSQITVEIEDPGAAIAKQGLTVLRTPVYFFFSAFEIAAFEWSQGTSADEHLTITCRAVGAQRLKRAKGPLTRSGLSPTEFMAFEAAAAGMRFVGQPSSKRGQIARVQNAQSDQSSWDVGNSLASELGYIMFESDNTLYFGKPSWLVSIAGTPLQVEWPDTGRSPTMQLNQMPTLRMSDDDANGASGTIALQKYGKARLIRPGMTMKVVGIPPFGPHVFLVDHVSWAEGSPLELNIDLKSPIDPTIAVQAPAKSGASGTVDGPVDIVDPSHVDSSRLENQIGALP